MAHYTFHWAFVTSKATIHIYATEAKHNDYNFGKKHGIAQQAAVGPDPYFRINLLDDPELKDHGSFDTQLWLKDKFDYRDLADEAISSGKSVFVINCQSGRMRSSIMANAIYKRAFHIQSADTVWTAFMKAKFTMKELSTNQVAIVKAVINAIPAQG